VEDHLRRNSPTRRNSATILLRFWHGTIAIRKESEIQSGILKRARKSALNKDPHLRSSPLLAGRGEERKGRFARPFI
jgi:hypothetical protein